jgi:vacuolar-type H+-ATPase subunit E/Vma4
MGIESVAVVNGKLRLYISLNESIPFAEIQQAVQDVLDNIANNPNYPPELNEAINNVLDSLLDPELDPEQAVQNLLEVLEGLSDEDQEQLLNDLLDEFQNTDLDFDEIFNLLP